MKRHAVSVKKKDVYPKNDGQQNIVYSFDAMLERLIGEQNTVKTDDYLKFAEKVFAEEGFIDMNVFANNSDKVSQVSIGKQQLSFSNISINRKCYETIIHELSHGICAFHYGYHYHDSHNELFVNILMDRVQRYCHLSENDILLKADQAGAKYFIDINLHNEILTKTDFDMKLKNFSGKNSVYTNLSAKNSFSSQSFIKDQNTLSTFFSNKNDMFLYTERTLLAFEKDLFVNPFTKPKELHNTILISPLFKTHKDGRINKNGRYHAFLICDFSKAVNGDRSFPLYQIKESASIERHKLLDKHKKTGFKVMTPKSMEQFFSLQNFFFENVSFSTC